MNTSDLQQSGMAIVEALVAASLLATGLLGASRLTLRTLDAAAQTRQLEQAQALAREALDCAVARILPCPSAESMTHEGTTYAIQKVETPIAPQLTEITVQIEWHSSTGAHQRSWRTRVSSLPDWLGVSLP